MPNTDDSLRKVRFQNQRLATLGIEVLAVQSIRQRLSIDVLQRAERIEFYLLMLVSSGRGQHMVDFTDYSVKPGSVIFARPGQVQKWCVNSNFTADLLMCDPIALPGFTSIFTGSDNHRDHRQLSLLEWQPRLALSGQPGAQIREEFAGLKKEIDHYDGTPIDTALIRSQLTVLLCRLARCQLDAHKPNANVSGKVRQTYFSFLHELEKRYKREHSVQYYVARLGYSESTLNRACIAELGCTAKAAIDARIVLEAQRFLAHSEWSVAEIAHRLGFSEPTNFSKFFRRLVGSTPAQFRIAKSA